MSSHSEQPALGLRERKKAKTRAAIQSHALRLFHEQGYEATTVEQIINAAEVSETTFFRYFPTKEDVVLSDDFDPLLATRFKEQPRELSPIQALRAAFGAVFANISKEELAEMRERIALIFSVPKLRSRMLDQFIGGMNLLSGALAERAHRRPDDFAVKSVSGAVIGVGIALMEVLAEDPTADIAALMDEALARLEAGLTL